MFEKFEKKADEILSKLTLKQKIAQLNQVPDAYSPEEIEVLKQKIRNGEIGSIVLATSATAGNDKQVVLDVEKFNEYQRIAVEESPSGIPLILGRDVIHGHNTVYPVPLASAAAFNPELVEKCYRNIAKEATNDGVHWTFSPMLDLCRDPRWGRIIEGPGEDPHVGSSLAAATIKGFQGESLSNEDSLVACAKHFIGYGASEGGRDYNHTEISDLALYNMYLAAFRTAVETGVGTVMSSFNDINGEYVNTKKYLTDILRKQLGFDGFVISDWASTKMPVKFGITETRADCAEMCLKSGLDMEMVEGCYIDCLEDLIKSGKVSEQVLDNAVRNILKVKLACGLFNNPYTKQKKIDRTAHLEDARKLAAESMVLLKNDGVLPLSKNSRIALLGPFTFERRSLLGSWTLDGDENETKNLCEALSDAISNDGKLLYNSSQYGVFDPSSLVISSAETVVLALGESYLVTGERRAVADISLETSQIELIKRIKASGKKVVGVFFCGRPLALEGVIDLLDAVIYAWHSGSETANAVCDILFGDVNPSGKTTITFPRKTGHIPTYYNLYYSGHNVDFYYGDSVYLSYTDGVSSPLFPFGYGLSYTTFEYSNIKADKNEISLEDLQNGKKFKLTVTVTNTGDFDGKETVQLYIRDKVASVMRPIKELKAFEKPFIKIGETVELQFELGYNQLGFYDKNGVYNVEPGEFDVFIGENCLTQNKVQIKVL